ncbi:cellulase family glycosylhydrolase [Mycolicibacterium neoaurum]|uniref:cellulase family glycosylhydrolase n=1 Tax=Mycolicibacterium neoaurum TaxID=1795 RepID=UPI00248C4FE8|nr:cellulase family glycosylhydrolase [Mycolicibacterium neoaurum]WBP94544.1 cellulase family glycosylhydrolase [Mycolicibacterium neoaurum]WBS08229.1 cellulase family glycosylhydrolase [Mycolicibacterium neoaurum]
MAAIVESPSTIGIADSEIYMSASIEEINERLDMMQSLGVTNVRIMVPWAGVQPLHPDTPFGLGAPRWDQLDKVVNAAAARGMGILGVLNSTPMWASSTTPLNGEPANFDQFAAFAKSVALRYGDKISAYEVWNEPNSIQFWNTLDPAAYTAMLKKTYTALKEAAAQVGTDITVIGGVIGAGKTWPGLTLNPIDFVKGMYDAGAHGYFDALSFHPYNFEWKFSVGEDLAWKEGMPLYQLNKIRELMDSHLQAGEEQIKIWITEYGIPTNRVDEATQAAFVRDIIEFWQTMQGAGPMFLYTIKDWLNPPADNDEANLGIFRPDGTMKPVGQVIKELIEFLGNPNNPGPGTGPGTGPGAGAEPFNPIAAFLQAIQQAFTSFFNFGGLFNAIGAMVSNFFNGIFGIRPTAAAEPASAMRMAAVEESDAPAETDKAGTEAATPALSEHGVQAGAVTESTPASEQVEAPVAEAPVEETPVAEVPVEETPVAEVPVEETPVVETPVVETPVVEAPVEETPVDEVVVDETATPKAPEKEDTSTSVKESEKETAAQEKDLKSDLKADTESEGSRDAKFSVRSEDTDAVRPNLKARDEISVRNPKGPRSESGTEVRTSTEASERPRNNESVSASTSSGDSE